MKRSGRWQHTAAVLALLGMVTPHQLLATQPQHDQPAASDSERTVQDVALDRDGKLHGQVVTEAGAAAADIEVAVTQDGRELKTVTTDQNGRFEIAGLRGGLYQVAAADQVSNYRLWAPRTAPPSAQQSALLVANGDVVRAQGGRIINFITNPWVLGIGVAAAIAIPLALDDDDEGS